MNILISYVKNDAAPKALELMNNLNRIAAANNFKSYIMQEVSFHEDYRQFSLDLDMLAEIAEKTVEKLGYTKSEQEYEQLTLF